MKKHVPQRTCIGCREVEAKREMMRIVRKPDGHVVADPTGKQAGRGAYLHKERECWDATLGARGRLEHALNMETPLVADDRVALEQLGALFPPRAVARATETRIAPATK
ncbi:MAG: YlxR family protein [Anaerolineae bacterium]